MREMFLGVAKLYFGGGHILGKLQKSTITFMNLAKTFCFIYLRIYLLCNLSVGPCCLLFCNP